MKRWIASLGLGLTLALPLAASMAAPPDAADLDGQIKTMNGGVVVNRAPQSPPGITSAPSPAIPGVESVDILKQDQAERTRVQPGNMAPTWRVVKEGVNNYSSLPAPEAGVLIQPKAQFPGQERAVTAGHAWRQFRNGPLTQIGGWLLVAALLGLAIVYKVFGQIRLKKAPTGRKIERFTGVERFVHWTCALSFVTLAATGLAILFGKYVVLPVFGHTLFGWIAYAGKNIHNFVGPVFAVSVVAMFFTFVKDNIPKAVDLVWLLRLGGLLGKDHASSHRFNGGEKVWFWGGVILLGLIVSASGFVLDKLVPGMAYFRGDMQIANVIHVVGAVLVMAASLGHIYMGTIGMEGAYDAMRTGYVDDTWAEEHHDLWYQDVASGKIPRVRSPEGAAGVGAQTNTQGAAG
ncbi:formate dehydrogenase subunit gamma [Noviherbaspirillum pedocola]|uniref:Formate dehydrogenase subunit gamma n=1 Tax=Noviherbaspirillum pedocola TaxID=2801341 RepID=A0A934SQ18_9BURK|nr:formate dehydrogenase subunit gamma [Noviherbaspirillum pedocola]MBK4734505.1 formate dehydrogenase subunit gamma [Noviherbaspirillum pedocola]